MGVGSVLLEQCGITNYNKQVKIITIWIESFVKIKIKSSKVTPCCLFSIARHHQGYATIKWQRWPEAPTATANLQLSQFDSLCIFSSQIHSKQKYPVGLFQMMRKIGRTSSRACNNQMAVLSEVPAVTTNSKVSHFVSSRFLQNHNSSLTNKQKYSVKYPVSYALVPTSSKTCTHATIK